MIRAVIAAIVAMATLITATLGLVVAAALLGAGGGGQCDLSAPGGATAVAPGPVPESLTAVTRSGIQITLDHNQLVRAATISAVGERVGAGRNGVLVALMAALTESELRLLANPSQVPSSTSFPNDGSGSDHDSLGLFQMRPSTGWGSVGQLMDPDFEARAFFGGPTGPNYPFPRGLLDITGWQQDDPGTAAQAVEVSAFPDRYQDYQPVAEAILTALASTRPPQPASSRPTRTMAPSDSFSAAVGCVRGEE